MISLVANRTTAQTEILEELEIGNSRLYFAPEVESQRERREPKQGTPTSRKRNPEALQGTLYGTPKGSP